MADTSRYNLRPTKKKVESRPSSEKKTQQRGPSPFQRKKRATVQPLLQRARKAMWSESQKQKSPKNPEGSELANMVANYAKLAANLVAKNDANLALPPRSRQLLTKLPL
ncbi:hypothetical protein TNCV_1647911 [Trichonephila clavipes]|uniref:Uncharacterized protein n=1 Tax=Trichonephila clavipes TaxID=2585209 RepID=A0A8X6RSK3_TRICX|nr:hypothetical protein TNCV_1647911 [Trichonephila clavipes]